MFRRSSSRSLSCTSAVWARVPDSGAPLADPTPVNVPPRVMATPVSRGSAPSGRPAESRSTARRPASPSLCAALAVRALGVPSGISSLAVTKSPST